MALSTDDADLRNAGIDALAAHPMLIREIWEHAPLNVQQTFSDHPIVVDRISMETL